MPHGKRMIAVFIATLLAAFIGYTYMANIGLPTILVVGILAVVFDFGLDKFLMRGA